MSNEVRVHTKVDGNAGKEIKDMKGAWEAFQKSGTKGLAIGTGIAAATAGFGLLDSAISTGIGFMGDSITKASDLNETMSKSEVIFGDNADAVETWGATMDKAGGLSKAAALDAASGFAGLFKTVGLNINQSTEMSEKLTQMGADLASFFNTDVGTALDALKSGLNGESEPLRQFNVFLSDTAVSSELAREGVRKVGCQFTEAQKATARYNLILQQTGDAQGDFARTSDGLANSSRITAAEVENLQAEVGQELLPVVKDLSNWAKNDGVPALSGLIGVVKELGYQTGGWGEKQAEVTERAQNFSAGLGLTKTAVDTLASSVEHGSVEIEKLARTDAFRAAAAAAEHARERIKGLGGAAQKAADDFADLKKNVDRAADAIAEAAYGPEELRLAFSKNRLELKDNEDELGAVRKKLDHLKAEGKKAPRELRERFLDLKSAVVDDKEEIIKTGIKLKDVGGISLTELQKEFRDSHIDLSHLTGDAKALWAWLNRASNVSLGGFNGGHGSDANDHGHASGGYQAPGKTAPVGEKGMEMLETLPGGGAVIHPLDGSGGAWGMTASPRAAAPLAAAGDTFININIHGVSVMTPGTAQAVADAVAPAITHWQQKRRVFAPR